MSKSGFLNDLKEFAKVLVPTFIVMWFLTTYIIANAVVPSGSMEPTIMTGSRLIGNRLSYRNKEPERGDIIIFRYPDDERVYFIKRIIGLPGEKVEIIPNDNGDGYGYVRVNGTRINEPYLTEKMIVTRYMAFDVPDGCYFFMGDNRNNSNDGRYWKTHYVTRKQLIAKALFQYWKGFKKL